MEWLPSEEEYNPGIAKEQWIISSNPEIFDAVSAFNELGIVDWKQSQKANFSVGDIVYIYISHKEQQIKLKTEVLKINIPTNEIIDDSKFYLNKDKLEPASNFMELKLIKNIKGSAFTKEALELFDFKSPQGPIKIKGNLKEYLSFIEYLQNKTELIPNTYDASYELVTEVVKSYAKMQDLSECDYNDLDLIYLSTVGTWKHSVEKKIDSVNKSNLPQIEKERLIAYITNLWERVQAREFSHCEEESKITFGMFGTGFYTTKTKTDSFNAQKLIQMCIDLLAVDNDEKAFEIVEKNIVSGFKGLAAGGISVILHCLKPFIFPILNSNQGKKNIFEKLGIKLSKTNSETTYIENSRKIKEYRDSNFSWKNYRIFDKENFESLQGDTQMTDYEKKLDEIKNNLSVNRNVILTGAPGTGKTFMAKTVAARIILEREINDFDKDLTEEEKKQVESQTGFVQFHPSYDYTDFVEGLRPTDKDGNGNVGFERKDGVFKEFCAKALENLVDSRKSKEELAIEKKASMSINQFLIDCIEHKTEFVNSYKAEKQNFYISNFDSGKIIIKYEDSNDTNFISIEDLKKCYISPKIFEKVSDISTVLNRNYYNPIDSYIFCIIDELRAKPAITYILGKTIPLKNFVFIIDEINRGEVAKIFGELFYCIDPGYRGEKGRIATQYQNLVTSGEFQKGFFIPENVYIIGTMNDIDRSVESMDFAFRRRFSWIEVKASNTQYMLDAELDKDLAEKAKRRMENLNAAISKIDELNDAYHIGASYFLKLKNYGGDFGKLWDYHIKGILTEYLRGNPNGKLDDLKAAYDKEEE